MNMKTTRGKQFIDEKFVRTGWIQQKIVDCRYAAVQMYETHVTDSEYIDCKFSAVNWRASKFRHVIFKNCILDKVDFSGSEFLSCQFLNCEWQEVNFTDCRTGVKKLVLDGTKIGVVAGLELLAGHTLTHEQAIGLLPTLLHEKGIEVEG